MNHARELAKMNEAWWEDGNPDAMTGNGQFVHETIEVLEDCYKSFGFIYLQPSDECSILTDHAPL